MDGAFIRNFLSRVSVKLTKIGCSFSTQSENINSSKPEFRSKSLVENCICSFRVLLAYRCSFNNILTSIQKTVRYLKQGNFDPKKACYCLANIRNVSFFKNYLASTIARNVTFPSNSWFVLEKADEFDFKCSQSLEYVLDNLVSIKR